MKRRCMLILLLSLSFSFGGGEELYLRYCASCHGTDRLGKSAPPLFPFLSFFPSDEKLYRIIKEGTVGMPAFGELGEKEIKQIVEFIKKPIDKEMLKWDKDRIVKSTQVLQLNKVEIKKLKDYTLVVERGRGLLWVMEGERLLEKFPFSNIHGGIKFSREGIAYIPSRDGWIGRYEAQRGELKKVRVCIYLRNIALSPDEKYLVASCWLPSELVILDNELNYVKNLKLDGTVSAVYELTSQNSFIFTFRDRPAVGFLSAKDLKLQIKPTEEPLEDFVIDPLEEYLIGSTREGLKVYSLMDLKLVKEIKAEGIPHLASAYFWYSKGTFYFATPLLKKPALSVWKAYEWEPVKDIPLEGQGFLARSNYLTPYIWVDTSTDSLLLLDKRTLDVRKITPKVGSRATHTEFTGDGRIAYVSLYGREGALVLYDAVKLKRLKEFPAELPAGKYNFINKKREFEGAQLGYQVFMEKCWGCHHPTKPAFGPALSWSARNRDKALLMAQI
ncbi:MAG: cytochrome D1 domain-containing protein, partial [Hydrogenobacter sp.]